jgi:hypothetical protein
VAFSSALWRHLLQGQTLDKLLMPSGRGKSSTFSLLKRSSEIFCNRNYWAHPKPSTLLDSMPIHGSFMVAPHHLLAQTLTPPSRRLRERRTDATWGETEMEKYEDK